MVFFILALIFYNIWNLAIPQDFSFASMNYATVALIFCISIVTEGLAEPMVYAFNFYHYSITLSELSELSSLVFHVWQGRVFSAL